MPDIDNAFYHVGCAALIYIETCEELGVASRLAGYHRQALEQAVDDYHAAENRGIERLRLNRPITEQLRESNGSRGARPDV